MDRSQALMIDFMVVLIMAWVFTLVIMMSGPETKRNHGNLPPQKLPDSMTVQRKDWYAKPEDEGRIIIGMIRVESNDLSL